MEVDHLSNLRKLREILRRQRRELVATMVGTKKEPTKFAPFVEIQQACDAVEWALDDEAEAAKEDERQ
jgi:acyl-CoA reductase-like NAD-dependent aldehyde dehydrogenase